MLEKISRFSCRFPWLIFIVAGLITILAMQQIKDNAYFEADLIKFLPTHLSAVKSDDYSHKNFNTKDTVLIGVEKKNGSVLDIDVLRSTEKIVLELKDLKASKTFYSQLKGETVTLVQSVGIDPDEVISIANLEDPLLDKETGSVVTGSIIEKLKKDYGIPSKPGKEELLPENDEDLKKIIPGLKKRVMEERMFKDSIMSSNMHASTIRASTHRKQAYKRRYIILELSTALDESALKSRFQGKNNAFPFEIYGKTVNGININDQYIQKHSKKIRTKLKPYLEKELRAVFEDEPELKRLLEDELTVSSFTAIMQTIERTDFFMHPEIGTWRSFIDSLYEFTLKNIDPFSRENLEFHIHNVNGMIDMAEVYYLIRDVVNKYTPEGVSIYVAGNPVVIGVLSKMMNDDMQRLVPIAILVILLMLFLSFRSVRGVIIPLVTVVLAVVWTLGLMAFLRVPFTISTSGLPIIILAIGTAYSIHLLNRFYEDAQTSQDRRVVVQTAVNHVGKAIVLAAVTTIAGFSSLATTSLTTIQHFGQFSAVGVVFALLLTLTLTPAMLVLWKIPKNNPLANKGNPDKLAPTAMLLEKCSRSVIKRPGTVLTVILGIMVLSVLLMRNNYFEGSVMDTFKEDNILFKSDRFLNKELTGTGEINMIFSFRDEVNLENPAFQKNLQERVGYFTAATDSLIADYPDKKESLILELSQQLNISSANLPESKDEFFAQIQLFKHMLNEEYVVELSTEDGTDSSDQLESAADSDELDSTDSDELDSLGDGGEGDLDGLGEESDEASEETEGLFADLSKEQIAGLKELNKRMGKPEDSWEENAKSILWLRESKNSPKGITLQREFNLMNDILAVDIKQPVVLHKLEAFYQFLKNMDQPRIVYDGKVVKPSGMVITPVDFVRKFYKVFYHDDKPEFNRLPDVDRDGFTDKTLTNRSIIGVVLNQALNAGRDDFEAMIKPDLKEFHVKIMIRDGSTVVIDNYVKITTKKFNELFPKDDPYIESVMVGGGAYTGMQLARLISDSQTQSILLSFLFVFIVTFFIFKSLGGGFYSLIPLTFTVILNFGFIGLLGGKITMTTMMVSSVAIGIGVDYTIHFLERFKIQLREGDSLTEAYINTTTSSGRAILVNAAAVALGFLVFLMSAFNSQIMLGTLVAATMFFSSFGALIMLPVVILKTRPKFLRKIQLEKVNVQEDDQLPN